MTYSINNKNQDLNNYNAFRNTYGDASEGFKCREIAQEYAKLYKKWWGSNLVFLGIDEIDGLFFPKFNLFD